MGLAVYTELVKAHWHITEFTLSTFKRIKVKHPFPLTIDVELSHKVALCLSVHATIILKNLHAKVQSFLLFQENMDLGQFNFKSYVQVRGSLMLYEKWENFNNSTFRKPVELSLQTDFTVSWPYIGNPHTQNLTA